MRGFRQTGWPLADTYVNNRPMYSVPRTTAAKVASTATNVGTSSVQTHSYSNKGGNVGEPMVKHCHRFQSTQHLVKAVVLVVEGITQVD